MSGTLSRSILIIVAFLPLAVEGQSSCPTITGSAVTPVFYNANGTTVYKETFSFSNPTSGKKSINVVISCGGVQAISQCFDASASAGTYVTNTFTCATGSVPPVTFNSFTGNTNCSGTFCNSITLSAPLASVIYGETMEREDKALKFQCNVANPSEVLKLELLYGVYGSEFHTIGFLTPVTQTKRRISVPAVDGYYRIRCVQKNGIVSYSATFHSQTEDEKLLSVFPVPAHDFITVQGVPEHEKFAVISGDGKVLINASLSSATIDIHTLRPGLYYLKAGNSQSGIAFLKKD